MPWVHKRNEELQPERVPSVHLVGKSEHTQIISAKSANSGVLGGRRECSRFGISLVQPLSLSIAFGKGTAGFPSCSLLAFIKALTQKIIFSDFFIFCSRESVLVSDLDGTVGQTGCLPSNISFASK